MFTIIVICGHAKKMKQIRKNKYVMTNVVHPITTDIKKGKVSSSKSLDKNLLVHAKKDASSKSETDKGSHSESRVSSSRNADSQDRSIEENIDSVRERSGQDSGRVVFEKINLDARDKWTGSIEHVIVENRNLKGKLEESQEGSGRDIPQVNLEIPGDREVPARFGRGETYKKPLEFGGKVPSPGKRERGSPQKWVENKDLSVVQRRGRRPMGQIRLGED